MKTRALTWTVLLAIPAVTTLAARWHGPADTATLTGAALGREVYIEEGCIHCHSQYVRPGSSDEELWGAAHDPEFSRGQSPSLIGNRRQGPDLMNVGLRLPRAWHRIHLIDPRRVSPQSRMPGYAHLFAPGDPRGEALLDYLESLGRERADEAPEIAPARDAAPPPSRSHP
jgi:cytochrome c oxidase cbb3-type subunit 2